MIWYTNTNGNWHEFPEFVALAKLAKNESKWIVSFIKVGGHDS